MNYTNIFLVSLLKGSKVFSSRRVERPCSHFIWNAGYPAVCGTDFMSAVKANSSKWVNEEQFIKGKFQWQEGYGAFSFAKSQRDIVIKYIMNQV